MYQYVLSLMFLNLNIQGIPIDNQHPIRNVSSVLKCRDFCKYNSKCTAAVWNCAQDCYLKQDELEPIERFEQCTSSWIKNPIHRRLFMTRTSCRKSSKKFSIVVAYFSGLSEKTSIILNQWLKKNFFVYIYHHVDSIVNYEVPDDLKFCEKSVFCKLDILQNVGREAHVYISHILQNYESLKTLTFFIQENEFLGLEDILMSTLSNQMPPNIYFVSGSSYPCKGAENLGQNFCWESGDLKPIMMQVFNILEKPFPLSNFLCGLRGTFVASKRAIKSVSIAKYQQLYNLLEKKEKVYLKGCKSYYKNQVPNSGTLASHVLERLWPIIFNTENATCEKCNHDLEVRLGDPSPNQRFLPLLYSKNDEHEIEMSKLKHALLSPKILSNFKFAVSNAVSQSSATVPNGCVTITIANTYHRPLRELTLKRIKSDNGFMRRFVSLCFGFRDSFGTCVKALNIKGSNFNGGLYHALLWTKWHLLAACTTITRFTLFLDSDVVIFRNPWTVLSHLQLQYPSSYHALFQAEGSCASCHHCPFINKTRFTDENSWVCGEYKQCPVNGGQIMINNAYPETIRKVLDVQPCKMNEETPLDQHLFDMLQDDPENHMKICSLPDMFAGHCWLLNRNPIELCGLISYHTQCLSTKKEKLFWIKHVLQQTENCSHI